MAITTQQISERLLKKSQGVVDTKYPLSLRGITEEGIGTYNLVRPNDIWTDADSIPTTPPILVSGATSGVVQYYDKLQLKIVDGGTTVSFKSPSGETTDMITGKFAFGYIPKIYDNTGTVQIYKGSPIIDAETGIVTFYDINENGIEAVINAINPPRISFYKYVGSRGVNVDGSSATLTGLTVNGNITISGGTIYGNGSGLTGITASGITGIQLDRIYSTNGNSAVIYGSGMTVNTGITAISFKTPTGASSQFLMADGTTSTTGDTLTAYDSRYINTTGDTMTGNLIANSITLNDSFIVTNVSGDTILNVSSDVSDNILEVLDANNSPVFSVSNDGTIKQNSVTVVGVTSSSSPHSIMLIDKASCKAIFFDYVVHETINNGYRCGTVMCVHDGINIKYTETSTEDLNSSTLGLNFSTIINNTNVELIANVSSSTFNITCGVKKI